MGKKSSAKAQARPSPPGQPPETPRRSFTPLVAIAIAAVVIVSVVALKRGSDAGSQPDPTAAQTAPAAPAVVDPPVYAALGPHPQANLPPLPSQSFPPPRPMEVVRTAYRFAAEHPEILSYVPCFCGCEHAGHRGNEDCFVKARDSKGDVTEWDPHGLDCAVCLDVATEASQMHRSGASVRDIRQAIEKKWSSPSAGHTPTPMPPAK